MSGRVRQLLRTLAGSAAPDPRLDELSSTTAELRLAVERTAQQLTALTATVDSASQQTTEQLETLRGELDTRVRMASLPEARLLSDAIVLDGPPSARLRVVRRVVGAPVERRFAPWIGITRCVSTAPEVRDLWDRLLAAEATTDGILRGGPSTVLDVTEATASRQDDSRLRLLLQPRFRSQGVVPDAGGTVAVPRFVYAFPPRKLRNFAHWLLDCLPQVAALSAVAPGASFLLPHPLNEVQRATLLLAGLTPAQIVPWQGEAVRAPRLLAFESDGRAGGGRPLSALLDMRRHIAASPHTTPSRMIYVTRRDAKPKRRWAANEPDVEALFQRRGFEVVCISEHPFAEIVTRFREARVVAGINGAGLAHVLFSPPGTHVITLLGDSLMRWHADDSGARSLWTGDRHHYDGPLAALGDSPRFYAHLAAAFEQYCHAFVGPDSVPLDQLSLFVDEVMTKAGCV